jgi:8-oxo-dGTP pyrophosphatase MutT (NUDIX family)
MRDYQHLRVMMARKKSQVALMIVTCGTYLYSSLLKKFLVVHPTKTRWNNWSIPKGVIEKGEGIFDVCVRELLEETGIDINKINVLTKHSLPVRKYQKQEKSLESFLVVTDIDFSQHKFTSNLVEGKDFPENDKWKWVTLEEAVGIIHETQAENLPLIAKLVG